MVCVKTWGAHQKTIQGTFMTSKYAEDIQNSDCRFVECIWLHLKVVDCVTTKLLERNLDKFWKDQENITIASPLSHIDYNSIQKLNKMNS